MLNAATKHIRFIRNGAVFGLALLAAACTGNGDKEKATLLLDEAQKAFEARNYVEALALIDSIKSAYPKQIDIRREALHLSTRRRRV